MIRESSALILTPKKLFLFTLSLNVEKYREELESLV